jgi:leucyl aminopeptidase (aminopeptidase T)
MRPEERIKLFKAVFAPKPGEKILFLIDIPHDDIRDSAAWKGRREMAREWYSTFREMGAERGFSVVILEYMATGQPNAPIPREIVDAVRKSNLVIAMTEFSATSSLVPICLAEESITRCASMPMVERRMEETAFRANYAEVQVYATAIERILNNAIAAEVVFSTGDTLYVDLRNRVAKSESGDCSIKGQFINFPSGEGWKAPYEATSEEIYKFGESKTEGILPVSYNEEIVKYVIKNNRIVKIIGNSRKAEEMRIFFAENDARRNIAELGIGCNPKAVITGNILEDEKVGLHIEYGVSSHLGGKVKSDVHQDICYSKGCPVEGTTLTLVNSDGSKTELIRDAMMRYDLLK